MNDLIKLLYVTLILFTSRFLNAQNTTSCFYDAANPNPLSQNPGFNCPRPAFNPLTFQEIGCNYGYDSVNGLQTGHNCQNEQGYMILCQNDGVVGCPSVDPNNPDSGLVNNTNITYTTVLGYLNSDPCGYTATKNKGVSFIPSGFNQGQDAPVPICLFFGGGYSPVSAYDTSVVYKSLWYPKVDDVSLLRLSGSFAFGTDYWTHDCALRIALSYGKGIVSTPKRRFGFQALGQAYCSMVVPFWSMVVNVDQGVVTGFSWDDDCSLCDTDHCIDGACAIDMNQCYQFGGSTDCDLQVYILWSGTDASGYYFSSSDRSLSSFRRWSITGAFNSASTLLPGTLATVDTSGADTVGSNPKNFNR